MRLAKGDPSGELRPSLRIYHKALKMHQRSGYHSHLYFDDKSEALAASIYSEARQLDWVVEVGRFHPRPIGPHPCRQFQIRVTLDKLEEITAWFEARRNGLSVLIHPEIEDDYLAHTDLATWLGRPWPLKLAGLKGHPDSL